MATELKQRLLRYTLLLLCIHACLSGTMLADGNDDPRDQILAFYRQLDRSATASEADAVRLQYRQVTRMMDPRYPVSSEDVTMVLHADFHWLESAHTSMLMDKDAACMVVPRKETVFLRPVKDAEKRIADSFALHEDLLGKARVLSTRKDGKIRHVAFAPDPGIEQATGIRGMSYDIDTRSGQLRRIQLTYAEATGIRDITVEITGFDTAFKAAVRPPALKDLAAEDIRPLLPEAYRHYRIKDMRTDPTSQSH